MGKVLLHDMILWYFCYSLSFSLLAIGMIECNIALGKFKDAAHTAREMVLLFQKSAEVYYVMGIVLSKSPQGASEVLNELIYSW